MAEVLRYSVETGLAPSRRCERSRLYIALTCLLLSSILVLAAPLHAKSWRIADYRDTISISQNGNASVSERITLVFIGEWHGIHRTIPIEYPGPHGTNYTLFLDVTSVTDSGGKKLKFESHTSNGYRDLKIYIPDAVDTTETVQIDYAVRNAIRYFEGYDEFYWNVTGNDWPVDIDHASALVSLPENTAGSLKAQAFTGVYGSHDQEATSTVQGSHVEFETTNPPPMPTRSARNAARTNENARVWLSDPVPKNRSSREPNTTNGKKEMTAAKRPPITNAPIVNREMRRSRA